VDTPGEYWAQADRLRKEADRKHEWADELAQQARLLPNGVVTVNQPIDPSVWEGKGADGAGEWIARGAQRVIDAAGELEDIVRQLRAEADELDDQAGLYRRKGDQLYADRQANQPQIRSAR
jgi:uncharacterized coiled-coil DUF342 family protein